MFVAMNRKDGVALFLLFIEQGFQDKSLRSVQLELLAISQRFVLF